MKTQTSGIDDRRVRHRYRYRRSISCRQLWPNRETEVSLIGNWISVAIIGNYDYGPGARVELSLILRAIFDQTQLLELWRATYQVAITGASSGVKLVCVHSY
jgi:hypothetical protein